MPRKLTQDEFENRVRDKLGEEYKVISQYKTTGEPVKIKHLSCGNEYSMIGETVLYKNGSCPNCRESKTDNVDILKKRSKKQRKNHSDFICEFKKINNEDVELIGEYTTIRDRIEVKCSKCGRQWLMRPDAILRGDSCSCKRRKEHNQFVKEVNELTYYQYEVIGDYITNRTPVEIKHKECGYVYKITPTYFLVGGERCKKCFDSNAEGLIYDYLKINNYHFDYQYILEGCRNIKELSFDFKLKVDNEFFLLEIDGEHHWKPIYGEKMYEYTQELDAIKDKYCNDNDINLVRVEYSDCRNIINLVEQKLELVN